MTYELTNAAQLAAVQSALGLTPFTLLKTPLLGVLGDSITGNNSNYPNGGAITGNLLLPANGYANWACVLSMQSVRLPPTYIKGYPGQKTAYILANGLPAILALSPLPSIVCVEAGTNNIIASDGSQTFASITADLASIYTALLKAGIKVIAMPLTPRSDVVLTAAQVGVIMQVNRWIWEVAQKTYGVYVADYVKYLADPTSSLFAAVSGVLNLDLLHPNILGAYYIGRQVAKIFASLYPNVDVLPVNKAAWDATNAPYGNLMTNGMMIGTAGTLVSGLTGQIATSWSGSNASGATVAASVVASSQLPQFNMQQFAISGTYNTVGQSGGNPDTSQFVRVYQSIPQADFAQSAPLDVVEGMIYCEVDSGAQNIMGPSLLVRDASATNFNQGLYPALGGLPTEAWQGVITTGPFTMPAAQSPFLMAIMTLNGTTAGSGLSVAGTVRFGRAVLRKALP